MSSRDNKIARIIAFARVWESHGWKRRFHRLVPSGSPIVSSFSRYPKAIIAPGARFLPSVSCREFYKFITQRGTLNNGERGGDRRYDFWARLKALSTNPIQLVPFRPGPIRQFRLKDVTRDSVGSRVFSEQTFGKRNESHQVQSIFPTINAEMDDNVGYYWLNSPPCLTFFHLRLYITFTDISFRSLPWFPRVSHSLLTYVSSSRSTKTPRYDPIRCLQF